MDEIILPQRCLSFNFLLQGIVQCPEQHGDSLENMCICAFHPKVDISAAKDTQRFLFCVDSVT